jgi:hypothetical protein
MQVYHDSGRMRDFRCMLDFSQRTRLQSYTRLRLEDMTPVALPDSDRRRDSGRIS